MSVLTRGSSGGWSTVSNRSYYGNIVSNYAQALAQAQVIQDQTELDNKIFEYQNGNLDVASVKNFINGRIQGAISGSQKELDLKKLLQEVDNFEVRKQREIKRSQLEAKVASGGISAEERLQIEQEMLSNYKQGTPEYAEQLNIIASATEAQRVDKNNRRVAQLQSRLAEGGLSTEEQIEVLQEARDLADPGSPEQADLDVKIGTLQDKFELEQEEEEKFERLQEAEFRKSELLEKYVEGGISLEENLTINREMQGFVERGSKDYNRLKAQEAEILGAIEEEKLGKGMAGQGAAEKELVLNTRKALFDLEAREAEIERAFAAGQLTDVARRQALDEIVSGREKVVEDLGDLAFSTEGGADLVAKVQAQRSALAGTEKSFLSGNTLIAYNAQGQPVELTLKDGKLLPSDVSSLSEDADNTERLNLGTLDKKGRLSLEKDTSNVLTIQGPPGEGGKPTPLKVAVNPDGSLEVLVTKDINGAPTLVRSGQIFNSATQRNLLLPTKPGDAGYIPPRPESATSPSNQPKVLSPLETLINELKSRSNPPRNKIAKLEQQLREGRQSVPEGDEAVAGISRAENQALEQSQIAGGFTNLLRLPESRDNLSVGQPSQGKIKGLPIDLGVTEFASDKFGVDLTGFLNNLTKERGDVPFGTPTKGNIPGTTDFGITEAFSSGFNKLKDKIGSFFDRR